MNLDNEFHVVTKYLLQFHGVGAGASFTIRKLIWIILTSRYYVRQGVLAGVKIEKHMDIGGHKLNLSSRICS